MAGELKVGDRIGGYEIVELVGTGGMGRVYRAVQVRLQRMVALKVIRPEIAIDGTFRARFQREAQLAASIDHPNVVPVYEADEIDSQLFVTMRWVAGPDLRRLLREGPLEPPRAVDIVDQIAQGLDAAHRVGLVHRDIKPANVLTEGSRVYLTDFGLARSLAGAEDRTATGGFVGTVDFAAPELLDGAQVGIPVDIYALGCLLFEALTGSVPFPVESLLAKLHAHGSAPPPAPSALRPGLPRGLDAVVQRAMAKRPEDRYGGALELAAAAKRALVDGDDVLVAAAEADTIPVTNRNAARDGPGAGAGDQPDKDAKPPRRRVPNRAIAAGIAGPLIAAAVIAFALLTSGGFGGTPERHAAKGAVAGVKTTATPTTTTAITVTTSGLLPPTTTDEVTSTPRLPVRSSLKHCRPARVAPVGDCLAPGGKTINEIGRLGTTVHMQRMNFRLNSVMLRRSIRTLAGEVVNPPPGSEFILLNVTATNLTSTIRAFEPETGTIAGRITSLLVYRGSSASEFEPIHEGKGDHQTDFEAQDIGGAQAISNSGADGISLDGVPLHPGAPSRGYLVFAYPTKLLRTHPTALLVVHELSAGFADSHPTPLSQAGIVFTL